MHPLINLNSLKLKIVKNSHFKKFIFRRKGAYRIKKNFFAFTENEKKFQISEYT